MGITHYRPYLFGRNFLVIIDHKSLQYLYNFEDPNGRLVRWILALQEYEFEVKYRLGNLNTVLRLSQDYRKTKNQALLK